MTRLIDLGFTYIERMKQGKFQVEMIATLPSIRKVVLTIYYGLVARKKIVAIEELKLQERTALWNECKEFCTGLSVEQRKDFARCYHALDEMTRLPRQGL